MILKYTILLFLMTCLLAPGQADSIDRQALVKRHCPTIQSVDPLSPFTVGNGEFAFTADVTGLQTLPRAYADGIPLTTMSQWGWHSFPNFKNFRMEQTFVHYQAGGRSVPYAAHMDTEPAQYLRANPHRLHLGKIGFQKWDGGKLAASDIDGIDQVLDLWHGILYSQFNYNGQNIAVQTCVHPHADQIAVRINAANLQQAGLAIGFDFPYGSNLWGKKAYDWEHPEKHTSLIVDQQSRSVVIQRQLDSTRYFVTIRWNGQAKFSATARHSFVLSIQTDSTFEFTCHFSPQPTENVHDAGQTFGQTRAHWPQFWQSGGAIDLSASADPRANELERRIVLSQYLTAIQSCGSLPPQETGLTVNSWHGKFHLEMHWWHAMHFVLWGRPELLENSLSWYEKILPAAGAKAELQGYKGVRWPKMCGLRGISSPSSVGEFLIWQQPHLIYFAEMLYRYYNCSEILQKYQKLVFQTAEFMASFVQYDAHADRYVLGPPLIPAQEIYSPDSTLNPAFELSYWRFGLQTAQTWRRRLNLPADSEWQQVIDHLAALPQNNGVYQNAENALTTFQNARHRNDHPTLLGAFGMLPNKNVNVDRMRRTLDKVMRSWNWQRTWGWDYPLVAMTAARVGRPEVAIEALLMDVPKNTYLNNGHNFQSARLPLYLPGNGGLLTAIAMMAAGWDDAPEQHAPGFPQNGQWNVKFENLDKLP